MIVVLRVRCDPGQTLEKTERTTISRQDVLRLGEKRRTYLLLRGGFIILPSKLCQKTPDLR